jgi:HAD superfamily hydrolase (TIGR01509 family)
VSIPSGTIREKSVVHRKYWIFDLDGTLTVPVHDFPALKRELGVPEHHDILGFLKSLPRKKADPLFQRLNRIERDLAERAKPAEGTLSLIEVLHQREVRMGILTRNTRENTLISLQQIGLKRYFSKELIQGREDSNPKPDPDGINNFLNQWGARPGEAVMVGDYLFDLQAGKNAGTATIHVDQTKTFPWEELTDVKVRSLLELCEML